MPEVIQQALDWLKSYPELQTTFYCFGFIILAIVANYIVKRILVRGLYKFLSQRTQQQNIADFGIVKRLSNIVPALILYQGTLVIAGLPEVLVKIVQNVCSAFIILTIALAIGAALNITNHLYNLRKDAHLKPIKGYIQVIKLLVYIVTVVLIISALIDKSPVILLSGIGAMAAVMMLIFQDTILSLVASVQISNSGMIRVGDWIEMPQKNADGDVIDIALHTVQIQNFDKTITVIPTKNFITEPYKNWRGMQESGGRRIKRPLYIDQQSIHFLTDEESQRLSKFVLLEKYFDSKREEIENWNDKLLQRHNNECHPANLRHLTNIGTFRAYIEWYLRNHPHIHQKMTLLVRQLNPTSDGLPLEIYCFTNNTAWAAYESIQADIFDHLYAIAPQFGLRIFQNPTGFDMQQMAKDLTNQH